MILSSLTAVLQVVLAVCICSIASQKIPSITAVTRDLSFLISHLLLPCLTFYNVAESLNIELLLQCSVLVVFSVVFALIGMVLGSVASALLFRTKNTGIPPKLQRNVRFELLNRVANASDPVNCGAIDDCKEFVLYVVVRGPVIADGFDARELVSSLRVPDEEYEKEPLYSCATILAMSVQNAITAPLSLIQAISMSMDWVDMGKSTSYIFMYSIVVTVVLWGVGPLLVSKAKRETERRHATRLIMEKQMRLQKYRDVTTQTEVRGAASHLVSGGGSACTPQPPSSRAWERVEVSATRNDSKAPAAAAQPSICKGLDSITHRQRFSLAETGVTCQTFPCDLLETGDICVVDNRNFSP
ncbi:hypothetical protein TRVL_02082 [Trypanosoma vivax]|nr:hypothetical protein TRVL_02082 [Trypanosoma vivax]